jgi:hypothetical protein
MPKRNKVFLFLVLPVAVLFWSTGWFFYWIGSERKSGKSKKLPTPSDLKFFVLTPEEKHVAKDTHSEP